MSPQGNQAQSPPDPDKVALPDLNLDDQVLAEIEGVAAKAKLGSAGEKVELDKADLPIFEEPEPEPEPQPEPEPEVEVDLAEDLPEEEAEPQQEPPRSKRRLLWLGGVVLAVLVGLGLGLWYGYLKPKETQKEEVWVFRAPMPDPKDTLRVSLEPFLVPLIPSQDGRLLKVAVTLESPDVESLEVLKERRRLLRDVIYRLLRDRPAAEIKSLQGKQLLRAQIKAELNHALNKPAVYQVLFTDFVITG
jgi:flagellar basal body-associated protein FliL